VVDDVVHLLARLLLRTLTPLTARSVLSTVCVLLPKRRGREEIRTALARLAARGTCLSRALAVEARAPGVDIVIGVLPPQNGRIALAHAWLELGGVPIDVSEAVGVEIARMPLRRPAPERTIRAHGDAP
jgi:hypothetical protein